MRQMKRGARGFTLIELVVVIAILGVLAAISVPLVSNYLGNSKERSWNVDRERIQVAVDTHYSTPGNTRFLGQRQYATLGALKSTYNTVTQPGLTCTPSVGTCTITLLVKAQSAPGLAVNETSPTVTVRTGTSTLQPNKTDIIITGLGTGLHTFSVTYRADFLLGTSTVRGVAASSSVGLASPANPLAGTRGGDPTWADFQNPDDGFRGTPGPVSEDHLQGPGGPCTTPVCGSLEADGGWKTVSVTRSAIAYYVDTRDYFIDFDTLVSAGLLDKVPSSASLDDKPSGSANTYSGSYSWYVDVTGKVHSLLYSYPTSSNKDYVSGTYP